MLIEKENIAQFFHESALQCPNAWDPDKIAYSRLDLGTIVTKTGQLHYLIDDIKILSRLGQFENGSIPYGLIHKALTASHREREIHEMIRTEGSEYWVETRPFDQDGFVDPHTTRNRAKQRSIGYVLPFSVAVGRGSGSCLEKSILVQLALQDTRHSFLVDGMMDDQFGSGFHAFNVVYIGENPALVDAENPLIINNRLVPYIAPLLQIHNGVLQVPIEWNAGRTYRIL